MATKETGAMTPGDTAVADVSKDGAFVRKDAIFRNRITPDGEYTPESGRYHLYVSYACPWACRVLSLLHLKGLTEHITVSSVHPTWQRTRPNDPDDQHAGWCFLGEDGASISGPSGVGSFPGGPKHACTPDDLFGSVFVRDLYDRAMDGAAKGTRFTVPILWCKKTDTIVSNESSEIIRDLNSQFNAIAGDKTLDLYPVKLRPAIDEVNEWVYHGINNGVYKCGFATSQGAYDTAVTELFRCLDKCEEILGRQRYIAGDALTEADVRLFPTLVRFDEVYVVYFKTNKKFIHQYPNLWNYVKDVYQTPGMRHSVNMWHIKTHYFTSHPVLNANAIVPIGPNLNLDEPHDRAGGWVDGTTRVYAK